MTFAARYAIGFPLLSDPDGTLAEKYVGVDEDGYAVPGVVVVGQNGQVLFRQVGDATGERIYAADLFAVLDRLDREGGVERRGARKSVTGGYGALERAQFRIDAAGGWSRQSDPVGSNAGAFRGGLSFLYPMHRNLGVTSRAGFRLGAIDAFELTAALRLRSPFLGDLGEIYLELPVGAAFSSDGDAMRARIGLVVGGEAGVQFAMRPGFGVALFTGGDWLSYEGRRGGGDNREYALRAGAAVIFLF